MLHCFLHILKDTIIVYPAILLVYILIELFEKKVGFFKNGKFLKTKASPIYGAVAGIVPQCGISVMASKLYEKKIIKTGTLFAVFVATSDEAIVILVSNGRFLDLLYLILGKFILAVICGFMINAFESKPLQSSDKDTEFTHKEVCAHCHHEDEHEKPSFFKEYLLVPIKHSLITLLFIFVINAIFGFGFHFVGEDKVLNFMEGTAYYQPAIVALIGLIPNCASSVLITQLFIRGGITFGSMFAGLVVNAGLGLAILFKDKNQIKRNIFILIGLYLVSVSVGMILTLII